MELIQVDDIRQQLVELRRIVRVADPGGHATLHDGRPRLLDFQFSSDMQWIEADLTKGLSFATSMKRLKSVLSTRGRFQTTLDIYVIDEERLSIEGLRLIHDRPGHASLVVARRMRVDELIVRLDRLAYLMEYIGTIRTSP